MIYSFINLSAKICSTLTSRYFKYSSKKRYFKYPLFPLQRGRQCYSGAGSIFVLDIPNYMFVPSGGLLYENLDHIN